MKCGPTVNEIFRAHAGAYLLKHPNTTLHERKVMRALEACRTEALGGRVEQCDRCGYTAILYNSCRNRHCPQCQSMNKEKWILERKNELLPFTYFHVVFTLPDALNPLVIRNKRLVYDLMFKSCKETLLSVSADERYFGADIGFFAILHTWGQKLNLHPHLHCVLPGGGYSEKKRKWIHAPDNYFVPVRVLKLRFRAIFLRGLKRLYRAHALYLQGTALSCVRNFQQLVDSLFDAEWVVYLKESFQSRERVIEYLARYTHRIAIANHRIITMKDGMVAFRYRDYADDNREKTMEMAADSFIRRFMLHTVPRRFVRIRYYGLLSHRNKREAVAACREFYGIRETQNTAPGTWRELYLRVTGRDLSCCPECKTGTLVATRFLDPLPYRAPPYNTHSVGSSFQFRNEA